MQNKETLEHILNLPVFQDFIKQEKKQQYIIWSWDAIRYEVSTKFYNASSHIQALKYFFEDSFNCLNLDSEEDVLVFAYRIFDSHPCITCVNIADKDIITYDRHFLTSFPCVKISTKNFFYNKTIL